MLQLAIATDRADLEARGDAELVRLAQCGDEDAVRVLIRRHNQRLFRVARGISGDDAEAEDIVQETYVRAFTHLGAFRGEALFTTWLTRIALNEALGRMRRRRPTVDLDDLDEGDSQGGSVIMFPTPSSSANPETETGRSQVRLVLERAVDGLPEPFRLVLVLRDLEGLSTEETATQLSLKAETVKTRLHRARRLMRKVIVEELGGEFAGLFPFGGARCARVADRVVERLRDAGVVTR